MSYWCTWVAALGFRADVARHITIDCERNNCFPYVKKQYRVLEIMPSYAVVNLNMVRGDRGEAIKSDMKIIFVKHILGWIKELSHKSVEVECLRNNTLNRYNE